MDPDELDAALLSMTDTQIMAALARRTAAKAAQKRELTAARVRKFRNAAGNDKVTPPVTPEKRNITSDGNAGGNADVTPDVTQEPPVLVPPLHPPSAPTHTPSPATLPAARQRTPPPPKPEDVGIPEVLSANPKFQPVWLRFIDMRRLIKEPLTHHAAELALTRLTERPQDAVALLELATERQWQGLRWGLLDKEREESQPGHFTPHPHGPHQRNSPGGNARSQTNRNDRTANAGSTSDYSGVGGTPSPPYEVRDVERPGASTDADGGSDLPA